MKKEFQKNLHGRGMFIKGNTVLENVDEGNLSRELEVAKFRSYGKEKFSELIHPHISFEEFIDHSSKFYSLRLPHEISSFFLRMDIAPYFWLSDAPFLDRIERILRSRNDKFQFIANYREVKEYYFKWVNQKSHKQKVYYAQSLINLVERNFAYQSFYNVILYGIILTYEEALYNPKKAAEMFERATEIVNQCGLEGNNHSEVLYYTNIFKGFLHIKEYEFQHAQQTFINALKLNPDGITAHFYCALSSRYVNDFDKAYDHLREVLHSDRLRFKFAINYNRLGLFTFFFENAAFYNVFIEPDFAQMLPDIDFLIRSLYSGEPDSMQKTYGVLINLDNLQNKDFFDDAVYREIKFLKQALEVYHSKKNGLTRIVEQIFRDKLITLIEYIRNLIETHYFEIIKEDMNIFDKQIKQNKRQLSLIFQEKDDAFKRVKLNNKEASEYLTETLKERTEALEHKIKNLDKNPNFNSSSVLYSSLLFTTIISIIIFLIVGFTSSFVETGEMSGMKGFAIRGLMWGGTTFIIGIFISIFTSFTTTWEKHSEKKRLTKKLEFIKQGSLQEQNELKEESDRRELIYKVKFEERIKAQEKIIENFEHEREQNYNHKYNAARKEMSDYINPLNKLLSSLNHADG